MNSTVSKHCYKVSACNALIYTLSLWLIKRVGCNVLDLEYFYGRERLPSVIDPATMTPAVKEFVEAMEMACQVNPALLVAHSYSRYLGDLSGGQILAKRLKKHVLQLRETDGAWDSDQGLQFYLFNNIGNENEFKAMYRDRLNTVPIDAKTRGLYRRLIII